jgi:hypothetical protein
MENKGHGASKQRKALLDTPEWKQVANFNSMASWNSHEQHRYVIYEVK